jgi:hypothetical protein
MNLVINLCKRKLTRMETNRMKKIFFPSCESTTPTTKLEVFVSKTKGLEGFAWIKSGVAMKKTSKIERHYQLQFPKKKVNPS